MTMQEIIEAVGAYGAFGSASVLNIDPIMTELCLLYTSPSPRDP